MSAEECKCGDVISHAKATESAIFSSLQNAYGKLEDENKWRLQADKLERKFTTAHGKHYSYFLGR